MDYFAKYKEGKRDEEHKLDFWKESMQSIYKNIFNNRIILHRKQLSQVFKLNDKNTNTIIELTSKYNIVCTYDKIINKEYYS